ncbi:hypothetical protein GCM10020258_49210 [Sphingomonas yabuuchiae]
MSGYGFGKRGGTPTPAASDEPLDLSGIKRAPMPTDPKREAAALERGAALGFVDRAERETATADTAPRRRRKAAPPQGSVYVKGHKRRSIGSWSSRTSAAIALTGKRSRNFAR